MQVPGMATARAAAHATAGAPRLYAAVRRTGAGVVEALAVLATSAAVLFVIAPRAAGVPGRQNAVRHFVWQALLTARHGRAIAEAVGEAQERGSARRRDSRIDRHNNAVGQEYGAEHGELGTMSWSAASRTALRAGLARWNAGELSG